MLTQLLRLLGDVVFLWGSKREETGRRHTLIGLLEPVSGRQVVDFAGIMC